MNNLGNGINYTPMQMGTYSKDMLGKETTNSVPVGGILSKHMLSEQSEEILEQVQTHSPEKAFYVKRNRKVVKKVSNRTSPSDVGSVANTVEQAGDITGGMIESVPVKKASEKAKEAVTDGVAGITEGQEAVMSAGKNLMIGAQLFIAGTTILDTAIKAKRNKEVRAQVEQQEKKLRSEEKRALAVRKKIHKRDSNVRINMGKEVFNMFDQAIGHHKMGNSRF